MPEHFSTPGAPPSRFTSSRTHSLLTHNSLAMSTCHQGMPDRFSANEVRAAFLRFFVSVFRNYQQYVYSPSQQQQPGGGEPPPPGEAFNKEVGSTCLVTVGSVAVCTGR